MTYGRKNIRKTTYFPCIPISKARAISYVKYGGNVFADSQVAARRLAVSAGNGANPVGPEKHGGSELIC